MGATSSKPFSNTLVHNPLDWHHFWLPSLLTLVLVSSSFHNYLAFHVLIEFFTVGVGITMFVVIWHTYKFSENHFLMFLGAGFLWIAVIDVIHALFYYGMPTAVDKGNLAAQFWIAARFCEALLLLTAPVYLVRAVDCRKFVPLFGIIAVIVVASVFAGLFPDAFIDGEGLTPFKVVSEYVISAILIAAALRLRHSRQHIEPIIYRLMLVSIGLTIVSELAFTFYISSYGLSNLIGHIFKLFSFWLIYVAIVRTSLLQPFHILGHDLQELHALHAEAQRMAKLGHWSLDLSNNHLVWSDQIFRIFGIDPKEFSASYEAFLNAIHPEDRDYVNATYQESVKSHQPYDIVHRLQMKDGSVKYVHEHCKTDYDESGHPLRSTGTVQDITERKLAELEVSKLARTDQLTQLPNRMHFFEALEKAIGQSKRHGSLIGLVMLDLDEFKPVNDTYGHQVGDAVLREVGRRLGSIFRDVDTVARLGGDEFAIILDAPESVEAACKPLYRALELLHQPIQVEGHKINIGASAGVSFYPAQSVKQDELIQMADAALYAAKNAGKGMVKIHDGKECRSASNH